ncbi:peptidoglycan-recognition protein LB-like [Battus philenor]|uniref:peptidoglycan-recognition protein LB-like n=1 Tax=Battus philenor TaxID=42288 RepID=UPI0035CFB5C8
MLKCFVILVLVAGCQSFPKPRDEVYQFPFMSRQAWGARPPVAERPLATPVPFVIIHHSYQPGACFTTEQCVRAMKIMQDVHQLHQGWDDIGYNFAVGSDGVVYEGRGWKNIGAHALGYNPDSIGIVLIGDWISEVPPANQLDAAQKLIALGVELGYISQDYVLMGHRQAGPTECPGEALFQEISSWDRFLLQKSSLTT